MTEKLEILDVVPWKRMRYLVTFLIFLAILACFTIRTTLSIAVVAMTDNSTNTDFETFDWPLYIQSTTQSAFFWGYVVTNIPVGIAAERYGPRWIFLGGVALCCLATYLIPAVASAGGWEALCALRVVQGATQGVVFPCMNALLAKWSPPAERGRLGSICFAGIQAGNIIVFPISGLLASSSGGWPSIFYTFSSVGVLWCVMWVLLGYNSPSTHPFISEQEKNFINHFYINKTAPPSFKIPWKNIVLSGPMWAILLAHCTQNWGYYMLLSEMPTYMKNILEYDIKSNGALTALPYIVMFILIFIVGAIADYLISRGYLTLTWSRKIFTSLGFLLPMAAMIGLTYVDREQKELAIALFVLSVGLNSGVYVGFQVNHVDLSPNFAGILMGITNGIANCVSLVVTLIVGVIVTNEKDSSQWSTVFWITAGIYLFGTIVYLFFGSAEIQPWNEANVKPSIEESRHSINNNTISNKF